MATLNVNPELAAPLTFLNKYFGKEQTYQISIYKFHPANITNCCFKWIRAPLLFSYVTSCQVNQFA